MPKINDRIFENTRYSNIMMRLKRLRDRASLKLQNPRLKHIKFHTFRHWFATMEYHKTKDILHVKKLLGHQKIETTPIYTQLITMENDDYHSAVAQTIQEARELVESGFEYVCTHRDSMTFRKRK